MQNTSVESELLDFEAVESPELDQSDPRHFSQYWLELAASHKKLRKNPDFVRAAEQTTRQLDRLTQRLPTLMDAEGVDSVLEVREWYLRLGSLSSLEGAKESLGIAGEIILQESDRRKLRVEELTLGGDIFQDLVLLGGRNETYRDSEQIRQYSALAHTFYDEVIADNHGDLTNANVQRATRSKIDLDFELLHQEWPLVPVAKNHSNELLREFRSRYRESLLNHSSKVGELIASHRWTIGELERERFIARDRNKKKEVKELGSRISGENARIAGELFLWLTPLAYRYALHRDGREESSTVRTDLQREHDPQFKQGYSKEKGKGGKKENVGPCQSIDIVQAFYEHGYLSETIHTQLKLGDASTHADYLPQIDVFDRFREQIQEFLESNRSEERENNSEDVCFINLVDDAASLISKNLDPLQDSTDKQKYVTVLEGLLTSVQSHFEAA